MKKPLPAWLFLLLALIVLASAFAPLLRVAFGLDATISQDFFTTVTLMIGGLMLGLTAMILMARSVA
ncbi:MAG: hypothetical protein AAF197_02260, partial [Pseudomonadota bacterium]